MKSSDMCSILQRSIGRQKKQLKSTSEMASKHTNLAESMKKIFRTKTFTLEVNRVFRSPSVSHALVYCLLEK
jgi:hypothetical protein